MSVCRREYLCLRGCRVCVIDIALAGSVVGWVASRPPPRPVAQRHRSFLYSPHSHMLDNTYIICVNFDDDAHPTPDVLPLRAPCPVPYPCVPIP